MRTKERASNLRTPPGPLIHAETEPPNGTLRTVLFAPTYPPAYLGGGPIRTLDALVREAPPGHSIRVFTSDRDLNQEQRLPVVANEWLPDHPAHVYYASVDRPLNLLMGLHAIWKTNPEVLYFNSFFNPTFSILPQVLWSAGRNKRVVKLLAPRGEFSRGALALKSVKKKAFISLYRTAGLHRRVIWHASSSGEAADIRRVWGDACTILVRENETSLPPLADAPSEPNSSTRAVFLGRIVPKKGLAVLLRALCQVILPIQVDIYGSDEDRRYALGCRRVASRLPEHVKVNFLGPLPPSAVRATLAAYDLLLMPTEGENFGHVIAEALSVSCPVMCTPDTPWTNLLQNGGGSIVPANRSEEWRVAIDKFGSLESHQKHEARLGARAAYAHWRAQPAEPHILDLVRHAVIRRGSHAG